MPVSTSETFDYVNTTVYRIRILRHSKIIFSREIHIFTDDESYVKIDINGKRQFFIDIFHLKQNFPQSLKGTFSRNSLPKEHAFSADWPAGKELGFMIWAMQSQNMRDSFLVRMLLY
jgi:hypothetical protein